MSAARAEDKLRLKVTQVEAIGGHQDENLIGIPNPAASRSNVQMAWTPWTPSGLSVGPCAVALQCVWKGMLVEMLLAYMVDPCIQKSAQRKLRPRLNPQAHKGLSRRKYYIPPGRIPRLSLFLGGGAGYTSN